MIWLLYIILDALANWFLIVKKRLTPNYGLLFFIRGLAAILYGITVLNVQNTEEALYWAGNILLPFPFLFNSILNKERGLDMDYYGAQSGTIDRFVVKHRLQNSYYWLTLILFAIAIKYFM